MRIEADVRKSILILKKDTFGQISWNLETERIHLYKRVPNKLYTPEYSTDTGGAMAVVSG